MNTKTRKQQATKDKYRVTGDGVHGVHTSLEAVVREAAFVDGMVEAMVMIGTTVVRARFTYAQALDADIIEIAR
jgi:hypothetical protein